MVGQHSKIKNYLIKFFMIIALLAGFLLILSGPMPVLAQEPTSSEEWTPPVLCAPRNCGGVRDSYSHIFKAPPGAVEAEVEVWWVWEGEPGQIQTNEIFSTSVGVDCFPDPGDEIPPQKCGKTRFAQSDNLKVTVTHLGYVEGPYGQTAGSIIAHLIVRWFLAPPEPPHCNSVELSLPDGSQIPAGGATIEVTVKADNASEYQLVRQDNGQVVAGPQTDNRFDQVSVLPGITYQAQVRSEGSDWTTAGCTFSYKAVSAPRCQSVELTPPAGSVIPDEGRTVKAVVKADNAAEYRVVRQGNGQVVAGPQTDNRFDQVSVLPGITYQAQVRNEDSDWTTESCTFSFRSELEIGGEDPICQSVAVNPSTAVTETLAAVDELDVDVKVKADNSTEYRLARTTDDEVVAGPQAQNEFRKVAVLSGVTYQAQVRNQNSDWTTSKACRFNLDFSASAPPELEVRPEPAITGQYQDFIGAVPFGTFTPYLEPGKEYFDGARSVMFNVEHIRPTSWRQGEVVYRFNGQEMSEVTSSIFHNGSFRQIKSVDGRAVTSTPRRKSFSSLGR